MSLTMFVKTVHISFQVNSQRSALVIHIPRRWFCCFSTWRSFILFHFFLRFDSGFSEDAKQTEGTEGGPNRAQVTPRQYLAFDSQLNPSGAVGQISRSPSLPAGQIN